MLVYCIVPIFTLRSGVSFVSWGGRGDTIYFDLYSIFSSFESSLQKAVKELNYGLYYFGFHFTIRNIYYICTEFFCKSTSILKFGVSCPRLCFWIVDIDECSEKYGLCAPHGTCINTPGGFKCICPRGYETDETGTMCIDVDECTDDSRCLDGCQVGFSLVDS